MRDDFLESIVLGLDNIRIELIGKEFHGVQRKEEGKDHESLQSSTTPDPEHYVVT